MALSLIATKICVPHLRDGLVARKELVERLKAGLIRPLTLVSAPAGYGKTTLLAELATQIPAAWLSLDEEDNDPVRFWGHFTAALQTRITHLSKDLQQILMSSDVPVTHALIVQVINEISNEEPPVQPYIIILDDYHLIEEKSIHKDLAFFLEHLPWQIRLVISTRVDPPLPLANMRARGQLSEFRAQELRFNLKEIETVLNGVAGLGLSQENISALETRTEGWIASLQMAAISMQNCKDIPAFITEFTGTHRYILDYLTGEVLERQTESTRSFLIETSILHHLSGPLCDAVTGRKDGQELLEQLEVANMFLIPLDEKRQWYRYHHLFSSLLANRLQQQNPGLVNELFKRATLWLSQNGLKEDAISYAMAGEDFELAAKLIESTLDECIFRAEVYTLLNRLARLPQEVVLKHPFLALSYALVQSYVGNPDAAEKWLKQTEGIRLEWRQEVELLVVKAQIAITRLDDRSAEELWQKVVKKRFDVSNVNQPEFQATLTRVLFAGYLLSHLQRTHGHLNQAIQTSLDLIDTYGNIQFSTPYAAMFAFPHLSAAVALYEHNDLENALHHAMTGMIIANQNQNKTFQATALTILDLINQASVKEMAKSDYPVLETIIQRDKRGNVEKSTGYPIMLLPFLVRTQFARGDFSAVTECLQDFMRIADIDQWRRLSASWPNDNIDVAVAYAALAEGKFKKAATLLEKLQKRAETAGRNGNLIELLLLRALVFQSTGNKSQAIDLVSKAVTIAEPEGYIRIFIDLGASIATLLKAVDLSNVSPHFVHKLLADFNKAGSNRQVSINFLAEPLTSRELEILNLLVSGLSNLEIAKKLILTLGTVKTHTHHIYAKLGVRTRTQAIKRATSLNLV
jgi:LuxR family transcriptional regulator, maltose regulon positive regulatory protein